MHSRVPPNPPIPIRIKPPSNAFNHVVVIGRTADYLSVGVSPVRLNLVLGRGVPVDIVQELDVKLDDGIPNTGILRLAADLGSGASFGDLGESDPLCHNAGIFDVAADNQDCNAVFLY